MSCIDEMHPAQRVGFAGYVYVPASWVFASMMFGVTLVDRKIISTISFGLVFGLLINGILLATVFAQEVHIPFVSTQKLLILCPPAEPGTRLASIVNKLDTSILS